MKKIIGGLVFATSFIVVSCNNDSKDDVQVKKETITIEEKAPAKETVVEVPVPPPPPSPKEVLKNLPKPPTPKEVLKNLPKPPLPPPPALPKPKG